MSMQVESAIRDALFREYDTLRSEALQSISNRTQIVSFGLGTLGVLAGGLFAADKPSTSLVFGIFSVALPVMSVLIYYSWFAEFERMVRAGRHLQRLEQKINLTFGREARVLSWELGLENKRLLYPYLAIAMLFLGIAAFAPCLGIWYSAPPRETSPEHLRYLELVLWRITELHADELVAFFGVSLISVVFAIGHTGWRFNYRLPRPLPARYNPKPAAERDANC